MLRVKYRRLVVRVMHGFKGTSMKWNNYPTVAKDGVSGITVDMKVKLLLRCTKFKH